MAIISGCDACEAYFIFSTEIEIEATIVTVGLRFPRSQSQVPPPYYQ
jgi:hypothetical protein